MKVIVIKEHISNYPNPIAFEQGETLQLGKHDTEFKGWIRVTTSDENEGWAPIQYIEFGSGSSQGIAQCSYNAHELNTKLSETLSVITELNGWYLVSNEQDDVGWVPVQTVKTE
jgi:hypothetical protein